MESLCFKSFSLYGNDHYNKLHTQSILPHLHITEFLTADENIRHLFQKHLHLVLVMWLGSLCYQTLCCNIAGTFLQVRHAITRSMHVSQVDGKPPEIQSKNFIFLLLLIHMKYANMTIQNVSIKDLIWGSHSCDYKELYLLRYNTTHWERTNVSEEHVTSIFSVKKLAKQKTNMKLVAEPACYLLHAGFLLGIFFNPKDGGDIFLWNISWLPVDYNSSCPTRENSLQNTSSCVR
jgi:hypothetical protein